MLYANNANMPDFLLIFTSWYNANLYVIINRETYWHPKGCGFDPGFQLAPC